jgi:hypothetical protein
VLGRVLNRNQRFITAFHVAWGGPFCSGTLLGSDAALKSRGNLCFFEDVGVEGFFAF